ncbi:MAG: hypothetical protein RLZZ230_797 [Candidatus Parcubacteria bacterium]|jgi:hypothetical protein
MNKKVVISLLIIGGCFSLAFVIYVYFDLNAEKVNDNYSTSVENSNPENNLDIKDMYFPVSIIQEINDTSLNGKVFEEINSKKYINDRFGFSFFIPNEMKLSNESSELWRRDGGENFIKHYLGFSLDYDKGIVFNSEMTPYDTLKEWEETDEGNYRLSSDNIVEPDYKNMFNSEVVVFDTQEFNTYDIFLIKNGALYEISVSGFTKEEREKFLNSIEFFTPVK